MGRFTRSLRAATLFLRGAWRDPRARWWRIASERSGDGPRPRRCQSAASISRPISTVSKAGPGSSFRSLASDHSSWDDQLSLLTQNFRVLRYDTRGHGRSSAPEGPYTFEHLTGDLLGLMDHYGIEKANFLGLSMGGMTGLGVAIEHPSRIARLICCDARSDAPPPFVDHWTARIASVESACNLEPVAAFNKGRWFTPAFITSHPYVVDKVMKMSSRPACEVISAAPAHSRSLTTSAIWAGSNTQRSSFAALRTERRLPPSCGR